MPLFIIVEVALGSLTGFTVKPGNFTSAVIAGILGVLILTFLVYQFCDPTACYYSGPDRLGGMRFFAVLATGFVAGAVIGNIRSQFNPQQRFPADNPLTLDRLFPFLWAVPVFVGSYAAAILYNVPSEFVFTLFLFLSYLAVSFLLTGLVSSLFLKKSRGQTIALCTSAQLALFFLFRNWSAITEANDIENSAIQLVSAIIGTVIMCLCGHWIGEYLRKRFDENALGVTRLVSLSQKEYSLLVISITIVFAFWFFDSHPGFYAPVDMLPRKIQSYTYTQQNLLSGAPDPIYYSGAFDADKYFPTKRVEVTIDMNVEHPNFAERDPKTNLMLIGIGAQSPNCCKDGLDYGYRIDIARLDNGHYYLIARAWETCDQNAACSGFPWQSTMHESELRLPVHFPTKVSLAMAWTKQSGKSVHWYYRFDNSKDWTEFSSFIPQRIENPYFNLGVAYVGNYATNFPSGNANFLQVGLAMKKNSSLPSGDMVTIECPAYYKNDGTISCFQNMKAIGYGDSHWKVWWQWGLPKGTPEVRVDDSRKTVEFIK